LLAGALLLFLYSPHPKQKVIPIVFLAASLLFAIVADSIYCRQTLLGIFYSSELIDAGWIASGLLVGLAGLSQFESVRSEEMGSEPVVRSRLFTRLSSIRSYLPYIILF